MTGDLPLADFWLLFAPAIGAALVAALLCGYLGFFVVVRRVAFLSAALGQVAGLGVASGFLLGTAFGLDPHERTPLLLDPVLMALVLTAAVAGVLGASIRARRTPQESVVAFAYLLAAALAIVVLARPQIVQEAHEIGDLLFGSTVAVRREHLVELIGVALLVLISHAFLFKDLLFVSFDREMARALGLPVTALEIYLHVSIGMAVAVATRAVGALPVFGFLVLPAGAALLASDSVRVVVIASCAGALLAALGGFYLSVAADLPAGPMMVVCAAAFWPLALLYRALFARGADPRAR